VKSLYKYIAIPLLLCLTEHANAQEKVEDIIRITPESKQQVMLSFAPVVSRTSASVVNIYTKRTVQTMRGASPLLHDDFLRQFFGDQFQMLGIPKERVVSSLGSGVIVKDSGVIITNNHVIKDSDTIKVVLHDNHELDAKVILQDERTDIALLQVKPGSVKLSAIELGDSDKAQVGDVVLAIGNPFGVGQTVTSGIISALARTKVGISDSQFFIQTDAAINPGNSGGALITLDGKLVGMNTAIYSRSGGSIGIGFAIPSNMIRAVMTGAKTDSSGVTKVIRPWFGGTLQPITPQIAESMGMEKPVGALINHIVKESPAAKAGLKTGDIIIGIDDLEVTDPNALEYHLTTKPIGGKSTLSILREGKQQSVIIAIESAPESMKDSATITGNNPLSGATVEAASPEIISESGLDGKMGVTITDIKSGTAADRFGFAKGDIIVKVNKTEIYSPKNLIDALAAKTLAYKIIINRQGQIITLMVSGR